MFLQTEGRIGEAVRSTLAISTSIHLPLQYFSKSKSREKGIARKRRREKWKQEKERKDQQKRNQEQLHIISFSFSKDILVVSHLCVVRNGEEEKGGNQPSQLLTPRNRATTTAIPVVKKYRREKG
eukprot:TRINITY_DN7147_c0_g1_i2.p1 TRINITY_DN7147_c0_g1~~TRINITY_DN7147_c0_g1_i2.p1  ORF type:complete len:125 (-),score=15.88 TRINITY_DN7147_c0_g1_i2:769-1143(-)